MELLNDDCISSILTYISDSYTYNSICLSCSFFYKLIKITHPNADICLVNHLSALLKLYPNKLWNWKRLSINPNVTWKIIQENIDKEWN